MSTNITYYSEEGLQKLKQDLAKLKTKGRSDIALQIAEARDKGDLSENAEYDAAKDAQGHLEARIARLEGLLSQARVMDKNKRNLSSVGILSNITIQNKKNKMLHTYMLVSEEEADLKTNKISVNSPIGKGLLGKKQGDTVHIETPAGKVAFQIIKIEL